jgi:hypothetical protein
MSCPHACYTYAAHFFSYSCHSCKHVILPLTPWTLIRVSLPSSTRWPVSTQSYHASSGISAYSCFSPRFSSSCSSCMWYGNRQLSGSHFKSVWTWMHVRNILLTCSLRHVYLVQVVTRIETVSFEFSYLLLHVHGSCEMLGAALTAPNDQWRITNCSGGGISRLFWSKE